MKNIIIWTLSFIVSSYGAAYILHTLSTLETTWFSIPTMGFVIIVWFVVVLKFIEAIGLLNIFDDDMYNDDVYKNDLD